VGYVIRMFPQLSETFVANEIFELERRDVALRLYSYRRPVQAVPHEVVRRIRTPVGYLPDPLYRSPRALLRAARAVRRTAPERYRSLRRAALARAVASRSVDPVRRFVQAVCLAARLPGSGVRHLHANFAHGPTDVTRLAASLAKLRFSFTAHARDIYTAPRHELRAKILEAAFVVTCTRANRDHLRDLAGPAGREKIHLVYHGTDVGKFRPAPPGLREDPPLLLSVGRLVPKKGFATLLEACARLRRRGHAFRCTILGEGPEREPLAAQVRALGLDGVVEMPGSRSQEQVLEAYRRATVFALPCTVLANGDRDGIPNVLVEAMGVGLPVISTAISGIPELVEDGRSGLLVGAGSEDLAAGLERLLGDAGLRRRLGANARRTVVERFDSAANAARVAELLLDACGVRSPRCVAGGPPRFPDAARAGG
jgi:glycosyltransferase involved in cell wall biosynthesis